MIQIINRQIIVLLMTLVTVTAAAYDFMVDGLCYNINGDGKSVSVTYERDGNYYPSSYISLSGDVTIPSNVTCDGKTYSVTSIGENAFGHCISITSVTIPNTVTSIGTGSFFCCRGMKNVIIPNSVTLIGSVSFAACSGLTSVTIPNSVITIGGSAFSGCTGMTSVTIPSSVTDVGVYAFNGCTGLTSVIWNVKNIWGYTSSSYAPFDGSTNLKSFTFGDEVENIPVCICSGLSGLTSVTIGNSVKTIGNHAFSDCSGLTSVSIPNSVTNIGGNAFNGCTGLTSLTIGNSVTSIGSNAFAGCSNLTTVNWNAANCADLSSGSTAQFSGVTTIKTVNFGGSVKRIPAYLCNGFTGLTSVTIPNSVATIGSCAFNGCSGLTSVTIPNSLITIEGSAFSGCTGLTSVTIPSSVTDVGVRAFKGCTGLTSVAWNVKNIWGYTSSSFAPFDGSTNLKSFTFGDEVENIPVCICSGLSSLISVTIGNSVKTLGNHAFSDCSGLTSVSIPNSVTNIGGNAFNGCTGLTSVSIGNSVAKIDNNSFANCSSLESITVHKAFPIAMDENNFDAEVYDSAVLYVPTGRTIFFQDDNVWGKFSNINEKDMPDVEVSSNPFDNLCSQRMVIGYTDSEFQGSIGWDKVDNVVQAIKFPVDRMQRIKGNKITHIRFSMWDTYTAASNMKVWIGSSRDNRDLAVKEVTDMHKGWNVIALDDPYIITGDSIIVGVEYKHDASKISYPVVWDPYSEGSCLYYREGKWNNEDGTFSIQCVVEGECLPKNDIKIVDFAGPLYKRAIKAGEDYDCTMTVRNWGSMPITSLSFLSKLAGEEVESGLKYSINMARGAGNHTISYRIKPGNGVSVGNHQLTIVPKTINGQDFTYSDDPIVTNMKIYEHDMGRQKVLVQVYSGTWCGYCPGFDEVVEKKRAECDYLSLISIHSRDFYTNAVCDNYLNMLYTSGIPNVDLNRCIEHTLKNYREYTMNYCLDDAKAQPAFANVNIAGKYENNSSTATFSISGEKNEDFIPVEEWTNLTVLLVEDNVLGGQYGTDLYPYPHQGIIRANLSAIWGDLVQWDGDHYQKSYTINLDDAWNFDNLRVVAFLSKPYTDRNYDEINVVNCEEMFLKDIFSGIDDVVVDPNTDAPNDVYDMYGRRVRTNTTSLEGLPSGIYIVGGKKVLKK